MDIRKIKKLIELVEESGITELEVQEEEGTVRISRAAPAVAPAAIQYAAAPVAPVAAPAAAPDTEVITILLIFLSPSATTPTFAIRPSIFTSPPACINL